MMTKGKCYTCKDAYSDAGMTRHIKACLVKEKGAKINNDYNREGMYLIKVQATYNQAYYLYLMINGCVLLSEIDQYLRDIWLECCGHLSSFKIDGVRYENDTEGAWGRVESMHVSIDEILYDDMTFSYEYDFGSTTHLKLKVLGRYTPLFGDKGIYLVGRNAIPQYECDYCTKIAKQQYDNMYSGDSGLVCYTCREKTDEDDEIAFFDMVNSPRMGVCGYNGPAQDILFMKHKEPVKRKHKKTHKKSERQPEEKLEFLEKLFTGTLTEEDLEDQIDVRQMFSKIANLSNRRPRSMPPFIIESYKLEGQLLKDYLVVLRKNELDTIRKELGVQNATSLKKDALIEALNTFILTRLENILITMLHTSYILLKKMKDEGQLIMSDEEDIPGIVKNLREKGLMFTVSEGEDEYEWVMPTDIKDDLEKLMSDEDFQKKRAFSDKISKSMMAIFYYWGVVEKYELMKQTARLVDTNVEDDAFLNIFNGMFNSMLGSYIEAKKIGKIMYYNMFSEESAKMVISKSWQQASYPVITKEMVPPGDEGWMSLVIHNPYLKWFYDLLTQANEEDIASGEVSGAVSDIALAALEIEPGTDTTAFAKALEMQDETSQLPYVKELLHHVLQHMPNYWIKGNAVSGEIHVNVEPYANWTPQTLPGKEAFYVKPLEKEQNSAKSAAAKWKVGRNDPCPCGSGIKFKKCCGR